MRLRSERTAASCGSGCSGASIAAGVCVSRCSAARTTAYSAEPSAQISGSTQRRFEWLPMTLPRAFTLGVTWAKTQE
ncbi:hypothetical protein [Pengzhenrongella phosphoraccumulans]|uniref:hypothetical protein n=1 Tax=Pengzhenrongella phosphoraccumulans TaxID=3114394 RepID=UPI00388F2BB6